MEDMKEKLKQLVKDNYRANRCGWTYQRSEGNYCDCFDDGVGNGESWLAYQVAQIIGLEVEEPESDEEDGQ
jgi:hypothetical protein